MRKILHIALREFVATVATKGFVIGLLLLPAMMAIVAIAAPRLFGQRNFRAEGQIAVMDPTGLVTPKLRDAVNPATIAARRAEDATRTLAAAPAAVRQVAGNTPALAAEFALGQIPNLTVVPEPADADVQQVKEWLKEDAAGASRHLALVVVHADAVAPAAGTYGSYDLYVPPNLDNRIENVVQQSLRDAIISARMGAERLDRGRIEALMRVERAPSVTVTKTNERATVSGFNVVLPFVFAGLMVFGILLGGQGLLTSTVEEKSSRVVEVLLSAVSPLELMAGKLIGQLGVSLVVLGVYGGIGLVALVSFALAGLLDPWLLFYLVVFFVIAYTVNASLMLGIGAAVNEMREAQSLLTPIVLLLMIPWMFAQPIGRDPNSTFSTVISFIPPVNTYTMLIRMASATPPPLWQVWLSIAIGIASALATVWGAAKVFRIGLLMYGKPPNFATLVRWARAA